MTQKLKQKTHPNSSLHLLLGAVLLVMVVLCGAVLDFNGGHFVYVLDDPYIHLTLAKQIAQGHYGLNAGEFASPSSSILWPFLLAPVAGISWGYLAPLLINVVSLLLTIVIIFNTLRHVYSRGTIAALLTFLVIIFSNSIGLVFIGMEHSLQLLLAVFIVSNMISLCEGRALSRWLGVALITAPLIRYEMFALVYGAVALLVWHRRFFYLIPAAIVTVIVAGFSFFLWQQSGFFLPASVLVKMEGSGSLWNTLSLLFICLFVAQLIQCYAGQKRKVLLLLYILAAALAHLLFARTGWFSRYEVYILVSLVFVSIYYQPGSGLIRRLRSTLGDKGKSSCGVYLIMFVYIAPLIYIIPLIYVMPTLSVPAASHAIYSQQVQMARLVETGGIPAVAVNDIGYIGYKGGAYIHDVWGLAVPQTHAMVKNQDPKLFAGVREKDIPLIMVYPHWFLPSMIPSYWVKLGSLKFREYAGFHNPLAHNTVDFYASSSAPVTKLNHAIDEWQKTLPKRAIWKAK